MVSWRVGLVRGGDEELLLATARGEGGGGTQVAQVREKSGGRGESDNPSLYNTRRKSRWRLLGIAVGVIRITELGLEIDHKELLSAEKERRGGEDPLRICIISGGSSEEKLLSAHSDTYGPNQHRTTRVNKSKTDPSQINGQELSCHVNNLHGRHVIQGSHVSSQQGSHMALASAQDSSTLHGRRYAEAVEASYNHSDKPGPYS
ncbi:hypothetical protein H6P81_011206 [Aristolochia fimbriata]|uniref:Uncharacterized protein n=1 Tax=Aristolochia fimbriata TaxID=158543 RepID=A0AAV7ETS2_ARIFI|nr:hypothetical protein H6P81_011206 [Aristolochia fimbriata]